MKVKLKNDWMGHKKGTVLNLTDIAAKRLIGMGTASQAMEKPKKGGETKEISSPPKDKMVKRPIRKK